MAANLSFSQPPPALRKSIKDWVPNTSHRIASPALPCVRTIPQPHHRTRRLGNRSGSRRRFARQRLLLRRSKTRTVSSRPDDDPSGTAFFSTNFRRTGREILLARHHCVSDAHFFVSPLVVAAHVSGYVLSSAEVVPSGSGDDRNFLTLGRRRLGWRGSLSMCII